MKKLRVGALVVLVFMSTCAHTAGRAPGLTIYYDGDSTVYGYTMTGGYPLGDLNSYNHDITNGIGVQQPNNVPARVQAAMRAAFGPVVSVENHGVGGTTIADSLNGSSSYDCRENGANPSNTCGPLRLRLKKSDAKIVVGKFLTNDQYRVTPAQWQQLWTTWIATVKASGKLPVIEESNPVCRGDAPDVGPYLAALRSAAADANVLAIPQHDFIYRSVNWIPMLPDCVHPNDALYAIMGDRAATAMGETVRQLLSR